MSSLTLRSPARQRVAPRSPLSPAPHPALVDLALAALGVGFGATLALSVTAESVAQLRAAGGVALYLGNVTGLAGTYLALVMVLLVSRVPVVEHVLGQDGLLRWHRRLAPWPISLITAHVVLLTIGYAQAAHTGIWHELATLLDSFPDVLIATVGFLILVAVAIASMRAIRARIGRERWWAIHLLMYLALALAFAHVIALGPSFVGHPLTRIVWVLFWCATAGLVLCYRIGLPALRSMRHHLRVYEVRREGHDVVSIICKGRNLERLAISGGQFFEWRFLRRGLWWQAHPFTLSARPSGPYLRLTVKGVGDFSKSLVHIRPGTRVAIEGPYGAFTVHARRRKKVALVAGGIGVTAIRAMLEDVPDGTDPVVVLRVSNEDDLVLRDEVAELVRQRNGQLHELVGSRSDVPVERIVSLIPDLERRDVFVAGPEDFVLHVVTAVEKLGVPRAAIHFDAYALP
jgi:predicted ferric reductase